MQIVWQRAAQGTQVCLEVSLLGQAFTLTMTGDVIVDSSWLLFGREGRSGHMEWADKLQSCLIGGKDKATEMRLLQRGTEYSRVVWEALTEIPVGEVLCYSDLADKLNSSPRAVAQACRSNPYPGIIPCHRVVSKSGLGGFMGQIQGPWVELKRQLLACERKVAYKAR